VEEHAEEAVATEEAPVAEAEATQEIIEEHAEEVVATAEATEQVEAPTAEATEEVATGGETAEHAEEVAEAVEPQAAPAETIQAQWQQLQVTNEGPSARYEHAMQYDPVTNRLFIVGGHNGDRIFDDTWALDLETLSWDFLAEEAISPTAPVLYSSVIIVDDAGQNLYLATGQGPNGTTNEVWKLDLNTQVWANITASTGQPPEPRYGTGGGKINNHLVVTHGFGATRYDDTWRLNTTSGQWENITPGGPLPLGRCLVASTPIANGLVMHGGCSTPVGPCYQDDTWVLDATANVWREVLSDLKPEGRQYHTLAATDANGIILFGGQDANQAPRNDLWVLNLETGGWQLVESAGGPAPRYNHTAAWIPGRGMLIFGGRDGSAAFNDLWLLTISSAAPETAAPTTEPTEAPAEAAPAPVPPTPTPELVSEHDGG
jgi:hypothetical protein